MFKRPIFVSMGVVGGLFLGATLGMILGATIGGAIDILEIKLSKGVEPGLGAVLGLLFGTILGSGLLSLGKVVFRANNKLSPGVIVCALIGLVTGFWGGSLFRGPITNYKFIIFGSSVGVWTGMAVGGFVGALLFLRASENETKDKDEEKKQNDKYAQFIKEKTDQK